MLNILDIEKFIKENNWKEVTNPRSFDKNLLPENDGLYSPIIFGNTKQEMFEKFGWINLGTRIMHPLLYKNIGLISGIFKKVIQKEIKVKIINGVLIEAPLNDTSSFAFTGIKDLYNNWDKIDFKQYSKEKRSKNKSLVNYILNTKRDMLFINKMVVLPINFRPAILKNGLMVEDEISGFYKALLGYNDQEKLNTEFMQQIMNLTDKTTMIQKKANDLYKYFIDFLDKKDGLFRTSLIGKRVNNVARLVANAQPEIPIDSVAIPWHACLNIFDLPLIGMLNKDPLGKEYSKRLGIVDLSPDDLADLFSFIYHNIDIYSKNNKELVKIWQELLLDTFNYHSDIRCFVKRDPAWSKNSYHLLKPIINTDEEFVCIINSMLYNPLGGDSFYTNYTTQIITGNLLHDDNFCIRTRSNKFYNIKSFDKIYQKL